MAEEKEKKTTAKKAASTTAKATTKSSSSTTAKKATTKTTATKATASKAKDVQETKEKKTTTKKATATKTTATKAATTKVNVEKPVAKKSEKSEKINVVSAKKQTKETVVFKNTPLDKLSSTVFTVEKDYKQAIFDTVLSERASRRMGNHATKTRAQVSGTGKKPFRQKGTGNARQGTLRAPHMPGGGVALGPVNIKNYSLKINKAVRRHALNASLALLAQANSVAIADLSMSAIKTKQLINKLSEFNAAHLRRVLIVSEDKNLFLSARNLSNVVVKKVTSILVEDLIQADALFISEKDVKYLEGLVG